MTARKPRVLPAMVTIPQSEFNELSEQANNAADWRMPIDPNNQPTFEDDDEPDDSPADRIARMLAGVSSDDERAQLKVYRVIGPNKYAWCDDYPVAEFEAGGLKMIRDAWGPGEFQVRLYATQPGTTRFNIRLKENITILENKNAPANANGATSEIMVMLAKLSDRIDQVAQAPVAPPVDQMAEMMKMMTLMKAMREATGGDAPKSTPLAEQLALIRELKSISGEFGGAAEEPEPSLTSMLPGVLELVKTGMNQQAQNRQQAAQPMQQIEAQPNPAPIRKPRAAQQESDSDMSIPNIADVVKFKAALAAISAMAGDDALIDDASDTLCDLIENLSHPGDAFDLIQSPEWYDVLVKFAPELAKDRVWIEKVRADCIDQFSDEEPAPVAVDTPAAPIP